MSDIKDFAEHIQAWYASRTAKLQQIIDAPASTEIQLGQDGSLVLSGEQAKHFRMGVMVALELIGKLPFEIEVDEDDDESADLDAATCEHAANALAATSAPAIPLLDEVIHERG